MKGEYDLAVSYIIQVNNAGILHTSGKKDQEKNTKH